MSVKQEILDSGVIEAHVLAVSSTEDSSMLESMSGMYPEIAFSIEESEEVLENLANHQSITLPDDFKDKIKSKLEFKSSNPSTIVQEKEFFSWKNVAIAASIAAIFSFGTTVYMGQKANTAESELQLARQQKQLLVAETNMVREQKDEFSNQLDFVLSSSSKTIVLSGQSFSPDSKATVFWNGKEVYLYANNFPTNENDSQYQLWAIVDGKPVDAGVFDINEFNKGLIKLKEITNPSAFAVTLEPKGGSKAPTLDKMLVLGNV